MEKEKSCSFFGHRKIDADNAFIESLKEVIESLITERGVKVFLFGSKSKFDSLCLCVVDGLKEKYPFIKRLAYTCKSEGCNLESSREINDRIYSRIYGYEVHVPCVDEEVSYKNKWVAGKSGYVQRNYAMIDDSDVCVFYYDKDLVEQSSGKSGTKIAYDYAVKKKKTIINLAEEIF